MKRYALLSSLLACLTLLLALAPHAALARTVTDQERADMESVIFYDDGTMHPIDGLEDADPALFEIGDTVPIYQHLSDGTINQSMEFIPLVYDGRYVAGFYKVCEGTYTYLTGMANVLQEYRDRTGADEVAVVFDANGMNITDGFELSLYSPPQDRELAESVLTYEPLGVDELSALDLGDATSTISAHDSTKRSSGSYSDNDLRQGFLRNPTEIRLTIQYQGQAPAIYTCWAACMSMVFGEATGLYYPAAYVAQWYYDLEGPSQGFSSPDCPRDGDWIADKLREDLGLGNYQYHDRDLVYFTGRVLFPMLKAYVDAGYPIISGIYAYYDETNPVPTNIYHVSVFDGYRSDCAAMVHDPWPTIGDVVAYPYFNYSYGAWVYYYSTLDINTGDPVYLTSLSHIKYDV